ncbi:hypothetical protein KUIN1_33780 [Pseudomonas sp. KUIN-1]|nr:hypothetical protein KUIN1_33780 [Pseudomonas sp. KUIN-1]
MASKHTEKAGAGTDRHIKECQRVAADAFREFSFETGVWEVVARRRGQRYV